MSRQDESPVGHRRLDTDQSEPGVAVAERVADIDGRDVCDLGMTYDGIDHLLEHVFSNPPSPEAHVVVEFTSEGHRITVEQDGSTEFLRVR